jgi:hypothetical protein
VQRSSNEAGSANDQRSHRQISALGCWSDGSTNR